MISLDSLRAYTGVDLPILFFSYPWLARHHPDPTGELFARVRPLLEAAIVYCDEEAGGPTASFGVFVDFMALPQRGYTSGFDVEVDDRTPEQRARFGRGLSNVAIWYAAKFTYTICLDGELPASAVNTAPYSKRGWCIFERRLASLVKNCNNLLQLSRWRMLPPLPGATYSPQSWFDIIAETAVKRPPPMAPDAFEALMLDGVAAEAECAGSGIRFTNGKDLLAVCVPQYKQSFLTLLGEAHTLDFASLGWTDADMVEVPSHGPRARRLSPHLLLPCLSSPSAVLPSPRCDTSMHLPSMPHAQSVRCGRSL